MMEVIIKIYPAVGNPYYVYRNDEGKVTQWIFID